MLKNKRQLVSEARMWMAIAANDLRSKVESFVEEVGTSAEELADALSVDVDEVEKMLEGNIDDLKLDTFAKLLIGTNNIIEIKPLNEMPNMPNMPNFGGMPHMPIGRFGQPIPNFGQQRAPRNVRPQEMPTMEGEPSPFATRKPKKTTPNRLPNGRFAPKATKRVRLDEMTLDTLTRQNLIDIINQNRWGGEIDIDELRRSDLIDFINHKIATETQREDTVNECQGFTENEVMPTDRITDSERDRIAQMLAEEVERNPHLKDMVRKYLR